MAAVEMMGLDELARGPLSSSEGEGGAQPN